MGLNSVNETDSNLELLRIIRESAAKASQANLAVADKQVASLDSAYQEGPRFGANSIVPQAFNNKAKNLSTQEWSGIGAEIINTQNITADRGQNTGRDNLEARTYMLDAQLDNKENTFVNFTAKDGTKYEAFRSKNATGVYYGIRASGEKDWQDLKISPHKDLQKTLDQAHTSKLKDIDRLGDYEHYKLDQKKQGEINDFNELYRDDNGQVKPGLDASRREALTKIESSKEILKDIDSIKRDHPELISDLVMIRFDKVSGIIGEEKLTTEKQNLEAELTKLGAKATEHGYDLSGVKDKDTLLTKLDQANLAIDTKIDATRNMAQRLSDKEEAEYKRIKGETGKIMKGLETKHSTNPEFSKLQERYKELSGPLDQDQGQYALTQLRALRAQLEQKLPDEKTFRTREEINAWLKDMPNTTRTLVRDPNGGKYNYYTKDADGNIYQDSGHMLAEKLDPNNKYLPLQSDSKFIIQQQEKGDYKAYRIDSRSASSRIIPYYDEASQATKVFAVNEDSGNKKYEEIQAIRIDRANIDAYKIKDGSEDKYYIVPKDAVSKNSLWELKLPNGEHGLISASQSNYKPDGAKTATIDGLDFHFDQNGNLISIVAPQRRSEGLSYELNQLNEAKKKIFGGY